MRRQLIYRDCSVGKKESITKMKLIENSVTILYIIRQCPNYIVLLCFLVLQREMEDTHPHLCHGLYSLLFFFSRAAPLPCQPVFTIQIRSIYKYLPWFFIKQSKSPDVGLVFASKGENQKQTREMPWLRDRDCMSGRGLKLKRLCSMFIPWHSNYPTTALILAAKNNITRIYMKSVKIALPLEAMLCLTWLSLRLEDP